MSAISDTATLPADFADLEAYVDWSVATEWDRIVLRQQRSDDEIRAFYSVMLPRLDKIVEYLNGYSLNSLPSSETRLLNLAKMIMEVANLVERGRSSVAAHFDVSRFVPIHYKRVI